MYSPLSYASMNKDKVIRCVVVDDEPFAIDLLTDYVEKHPDLSLAATFTNPIEALRFLRTESVGLLLLDIQMPELNGLQFARIVGGECPVIFTTAYGEHALESYELNVVDYLLKPISYERFCQGVEKLQRTTHGSARTHASLDKKDNEPAGVENRSMLFVKSGHKTLRIALNDILYLSGSGDYVTLFLKDGQKVLTLEKMGSFEEKLRPPKFCRIHRSHLVALNKIEFIERQRVIIQGEWLPISQSYQEGFWKLVQ